MAITLGFCCAASFLDEGFSSEIGHAYDLRYQRTQ